MSDLVSLVRRLTATLALSAFAVAMTAGAAQADNYGEIASFGSAGKGTGQLEPFEEAAGMGVDPTDNSVYVVDLPDEKDEFRLQKFTVNGEGKYTAVASVKFRPQDTEAKNEEADVVDNVVIDPVLKRVYVLASELRPSEKIDPEKVGAADLYAFSTEPSEGKLLPASGTPATGKETGVLAGPKILKPLSEKQGESLLEPAGIAVDPTNHDIILLGGEDPGHALGETLIAMERVSETGALGGKSKEPRWVDTTNYFEGEGATSPVVTPAGKVLVDNVDEIDEVPSNFAEKTAPKPIIEFEAASETLVEFPGNPLPEAGGGLSLGPEGTIYTKAGIVQQLNGEKTGYRYPGVLEFSSAGVEEGWTGGQSAATVGENGPCQIGYSAQSQLAAGKNHDVFVYDSTFTKPKVIEFGPGGTGCAKPSATKPTHSVSGIGVPEAEPIPIGDTVALSSQLTQGNALSVEWEFGDGTKQTVSADEFQTTEVTHKFTQAGALEITEKIHTDVLAEPELVIHGKINIQAPGPTAVTGEANPIGSTTATLNGTVNPNGAKVSECKFEYGTTTSYTASAPCAQKEPGGSGSSATAVTAAVTGLTAHTTYHFRLVVKNAGGAGEGLDGTFTTGPTPAVATEAATSLGETTATVHGTVNPQGAVVTKCQFEYGTASVSEHTEPCSPAGLGSGSTPVAVSASLTGLSAHTTYKFLLVAANASGKSQGTELTFTTTGTVVCTSGCGGGGGGGGGEGGGEGGGGGGGGGGTGGGAPGGGVLGNVVVKAVPIATLAGASASVSSAGAFTLKVSCPAGESSCSGAVTLKTLKAVVASVGHQAKAKASILTLATGSFSVAGGQTKTVTLHLSAKARSLLAKLHVIASRATLVAHDPAGATHTTTATVTLRAAKHH
jgi:hypothetical protein